MMPSMSRIAAWTTALLAVLLVAVASFGPASFLSGQRQDGAGSALVHGDVAVAATAPSAVRGILNENPPSVTPTPTVAAASTPIPPLARTVQIGAYNDASVVSGGMWSPDQNLGGWADLGVGPHGGGTFRSYLRFIVGGLPSGIQISSAILMLKPTDGGLNPVPIEAYYVQDDWGEGSITWNQQPLSTYRAGVGTWKPGSMDPFAIDVTSAVQQWYACGGTSNSGLELSADLASSWVDFGSRKSSVPPTLQVTYQTAVAPVNCSAPPTANVNLTAPQAAAPSTTGAQIGSINPNDLNNPAVLVGTPIGALSIPVAPNPSSSGSNAAATTTTGTGPTGGSSGLGTGPITLPPAPGSSSGATATGR